MFKVGEQISLGFEDYEITAINDREYTVKSLKTGNSKVVLDIFVQYYNEHQHHWPFAECACCFKKG